MLCSEPTKVLKVLDTPGVFFIPEEAKAIKFRVVFTICVGFFKRGHAFPFEVEKDRFILLNMSSVRRHFRGRYQYIP